MKLETRIWEMSRLIVLLILTLGSLYAASPRVCAQQWYGGGELLFVKITNDFDPAFFVETQTATAEVDNTISFDRDFDPAFRLWLGRTLGNGALVRSRLWFVDQTASQSIVTGPNQELEDFAFFLEAGPGSTGFAQSSIQAYSVDIEAGQIFRPSFGQFQLGGGLRIAGISGDSTVTFTEPTGQVSTSTTSSDSDGIGPTLFAEYERGLFGDFSLFASMRTSLVFTDSVAELRSSNSMGEEVSIAERDDIFTTNEVRFGLSRVKKVNNHDYFASTFLEYQAWESASTASSIGFADIGFASVGFQLGMLW